MYNIEIHKIDGTRATATAYENLQAQTRRVGFGRFSIPIPGVAAFGGEAIDVIITDTAVMDEDGNNIEAKINQAQIVAIRNEINLRRSAAWKFAQPVILVCGSLLLLLVIADGLSRRLLRESIEILPDVAGSLFTMQVFTGIACILLGGVLVFVVGLSNVFSLMVFYGPRLIVRREKNGDVTRTTFALISSRVLPGEKDVLRLPENFAARLSRLVSPAELIFLPPNASEGEKALYFSRLETASFAKNATLILPVFGAAPVAILRINGEAKHLSLEAHPFAKNVHWPHSDLRFASEAKFTKACEDFCKAIHQNSEVFLTQGVTNAGEMLQAYTSTMRVIAGATAMVLLFALPAFAQNYVAAVAALPGAATHIPDNREPVVYVFGNGNMPTHGNGFSTLPELLRNVPGYSDGENRGGLRFVSVGVGETQKRFAPEKAKPESARPVSAVAPTVGEDGFFWGDSAKNVERFSYINRSLRRGIIQATTPGGLAGAMDAVRVPLGAIWGLIVGLLYLVANSATAELFPKISKRVISFFEGVSEGFRFSLWCFLAAGAVFAFVRYWLWTVENWISWADVLMWALVSWLLYLTISTLVHDPKFAKRSHGGNYPVPHDR